MILLRGLLDRVVLLLGVVVGGCVPSFVNQYHQRVGGRLQQVREDLAPFREIAERYHGGSMDALVQHHLASSDPTFHAEGEAIQAMVNSESRLVEMLNALNTDIANQLGYLFFNRDPEIVSSTIEVFEPAFVLNADGLLLAVASGLLLWFVFLLLWKLLSLLMPFGRPARAR